MRRLGYTLFWLSMLALLVVLYRDIWPQLERGAISQLNAARVDAARISLAYELSSQHWTEFDLASTQNGLRLLSNALSAAELEHAEPAVYRYALELELLGTDSRVIRSWRYHHRTRFSHYRDPRTGERVRRSFFFDSDQIPLDGRVLRVSLPDDEGASRLRVRLAQSDAQIEGVIARVYQGERTPQRKLAYRWQRLSQEQKEQLADVSVYDADLLRESERNHLLRWEWRPLGPRGVEYQDYRVRRLYVLHEAVGEEWQASTLPSGRYLGPDTDAVLPLPETAGTVRIEFRALEEDTERASVLVRGYATGASGDFERAMQLDDNRSIEVNVGLAHTLHLSSAQRWTLRMFGLVNEEWVEITPEAAQVSAYRADGESRLRYAVEQVDGMHTQLRADLRALLIEDELPASWVGLSLFDLQGALLQQTRIALDTAVSQFDRPSGVADGAAVTELRRYFMHLDPQVAFVEFHSEGASLVNVYSRPSALPHRVKVPEYRFASVDDTVQQPVWFVLAPQDRLALQQQARVASLVVQGRPPQQDPLVAAGQYTWESYQPQSRWRGREALLPRDGDWPCSEWALAACFRTVLTDKETSVRFLKGPGRLPVEPTLIVQRNHARPTQMRILLDGREWYASELSERRQLLRLPAVKAGVHRIKIIAPGVQTAWLNFLAGDEPGYVRRTLMALPSQGVRLRIPKYGAGEEHLTLAVYGAEAEQVSIRTELQVPASSLRKNAGSLTLSQREFDVRIEGKRIGLLLHTRDQWVDGGQRLILPMGDDLLPGEYTMKISSSSQQPLYIAVYRLKPGVEDVRRVRQRNAGEGAFDG